MQMNLSSLDKFKKKYEDISVKKDAVYGRVIEAIKIVKEFIKARHLIIYGGTAIDFALRIKGDAIYTDESLLFPDLDFFSPDSVGDAADLADMLFKAGFEATRAIVASYVRTMRVDIMQNHFIADITFIDPIIFMTLPFVEYEGLRVLHPQFQKMDLHLSMTYPFDKSPREVIFERWTKDIERFNLLDKYYPSRGPVIAVDMVNGNAHMKLCETAALPLSLFNGTAFLGGFAAYCAIHDAFIALVALGRRLNIKTVATDALAARMTAVIPGSFKIVNGEILYDLPRGLPQVIYSYKSRELYEELTLAQRAKDNAQRAKDNAQGAKDNAQGGRKNISGDQKQTTGDDHRSTEPRQSLPRAEPMGHFAPYLKIVDERYEVKLSRSTLRIYVADDHLTSCNILLNDDRGKIACICVDAILSYFLAQAELFRSGAKCKESSNAVAHISSDIDKTTEDDSDQHQVWPSLPMQTSGPGLAEGIDVEFFYAYYGSLQDMVVIGQEIVVEILSDDKWPMDMKDRLRRFSPFSPSIITVGAKNDSETFMSAIMNLATMRRSDDPKYKPRPEGYALPTNYYPEKRFDSDGNALRPKPSFAYAASKFFMKAGERLA
jgi:hypothetical protein